MQSVLVTGGAGFIGTNLIEHLLEAGFKVTSVDNFDDYYPEEVKIKHSQLFKDHTLYKFLKLDLLDKALVLSELDEEYDAIIHLAARPGVRYSIKYPEITNKINIGSTESVIAFAEAKGIPKIVYASSSSIYGVNKNVPWTEDSSFEPISPYAESKIKCEEMGKGFVVKNKATFIALRFFSVYGKYGRPDLAIGKFASRIMNDVEIPVYGDGSFQRDFTHVEDIIDGIIKALNYSRQGFEAFNLGNTNTNSVMDMITLLEENIGKKAIIDWQPVQEGDVPITYADINKARDILGYQPKISLSEGIKSYISHLQNSFI